MKVFLSMFILSLVPSYYVSGQTKDVAPKDSTIIYADNTFFSPRLINGHSTEVTPKNRLDFKIEHRFSLINQGFDQLYGLDFANTFIGFEYGIKDWWMLGINRSITGLSSDKTIAGFTKFAVLRQSTGIKEMPLTVSLLLESSVLSTVLSNPSFYNDFGSRVSYTVQVLAARKFTDALSAQLSPVWIHRNTILSPTDNKDLFAMGFAASYKITPNLEINGEYYPVIGPSAYYKQNYHNCLSFGIDIHTFGHVFQIMLTNSTDMIEKNFIGETTDDWSKGGLHLGFNLLRKFQL